MWPYIHIYRCCCYRCWFPHYSAYYCPCNWRKYGDTCQQVSHRPIKCQSRVLWSQDTKRYQGQRVTSWWQTATQTNRDPNRDDKKLCDSASNGTDQSMSKRFIKPLYSIPRATSIDSDACRHLFFSERAVWGVGGGGMLPDFLFWSLFPVHERDWPPCNKVVFSGWQPIRWMWETTMIFL